MESRAARKRKKPGTQLTLGIRIRRWGGKRRGAGRQPKGDRPGVSHDCRGQVLPRFGVHLTARVRADVESLRSRPSFRIVMASLTAVKKKYGIRVSGLAVMGNHLHAILEADDRRTVSCAMNAWFTRMARAINRSEGRRGPVFEDRYHDRVLRSPTEARRAKAYVQGNAEHHYGKSGDPFIFVVAAGAGEAIGRALAAVGWVGPCPLQPARAWILAGAG